VLPLLISAGPATALDEPVRQGNAAFARQQYEEALQWYARATELTRDPGLIAFNQAAASYRLGRYDEAAAYYQRCLEDQAIPPARLTRASYDLGTALLQAGSDDRVRLEQAMAALRRCLQSGPPADLQADAQYNLELAKWLWLKAKPTPPTASPQPPDPPEKSSHSDPGSNGEAKKKAAANSGAVDGGPEKNGIDQPGLQSTKKKLAHGPLQVLPDNDKLTPLTADETEAHLEQFLERMRRERRSYWQQLGPAPADVKDW
jgi:tetratricopeptide (TPR) repeat protein